MIFRLLEVAFFDRWYWCIDIFSFEKESVFGGSLLLIEFDGWQWYFDFLFIRQIWYWIKEQIDVGHQEEDDGNGKD